MITEQELHSEVEKISELRLRYLNDSRRASPKKYDYQLKFKIIA